MSKTIDQILAPPYNAGLLLADGTLFPAYGVGAQGVSVGEVCFNTSMSGYQEIITDPSYAGQIINFTFPHIGNVGTNEFDHEKTAPALRGVIFHEAVTTPSNWRSTQSLDSWLEKHGIVGITGIDTRLLTKKLRDEGATIAAIGHFGSKGIDQPAMQAALKAFSGLEGLDLALQVTCKKPYEWVEGFVDIGAPDAQATAKPRKADRHVVAMDFGIKENILRCLVESGFRVTVVPATMSAEDILALKPDGVFLSNGPGDPQATGVYAVPVIRHLMDKNIPIFGICLGHQLLSLAVGGKTTKMKFGHRGANHPVLNLQTALVEITSQNHGFEVQEESLPANVIPTHKNLFDGTNEGIRVLDRPAFSVQYHPEASPGPHDSYYLFQDFRQLIDNTRNASGKEKNYAKAG